MDRSAQLQPVFFTRASSQCRDMKIIDRVLYRVLTSSAAAGSPGSYREFAAGYTHRVQHHNPVSVVSSGPDRHPSNRHPKASEPTLAHTRLNDDPIRLRFPARGSCVLALSPTSSSEHLRGQRVPFRELHVLIAAESPVLDSTLYSLGLEFLSVLCDVRRELDTVAVFSAHLIVGVPGTNRLHSIIDR